MRVRRSSCAPTSGDWLCTSVAAGVGFTVPAVPNVPVKAAMEGERLMKRDGAGWTTGVARPSKALADIDRSDTVELEAEVRNKSASGVAGRVKREKGEPTLPVRKPAILENKGELEGGVPVVPVGAGAGVTGGAGFCAGSASR